MYMVRLSHVSSERTLSGGSLILSQLILYLIWHIQCVRIIIACLFKTLYGFRSRKSSLKSEMLVSDWDHRKLYMNEVQSRLIRQLRARSKLIRFLELYPKDLIYVSWSQMNLYFIFCLLNKMSWSIDDLNMWQPLLCQPLF